MSIDAPAETDRPDGWSELDLLIAFSASRIHQGAVILDAPEQPQSVWGQGHRCVWAVGEPFLLCGPDGVGKTTLAQQLVKARAGISTDPLLGLTVEPSDRPVLYLACDRPAQALRSFRRMVDNTDRQALDERLIIWRGPLPFDLGKQPDGLTVLAKRLDVGTVFIDSLKDVASDLSKEETGGRVNAAFQTAVAEGIEVCALHHQRKAQAGGGKPKTISDVYGSRWLTGGAGSVVMLWGDPGDLVVDFDHLKQPDETVGPFQVIHDHHAGSTTTVDHLDAWTLVQTAHKGTTAMAVACRLYGKTEPTRNETEKARRQLERLTNEGRIYRKEGSKGGVGGGVATLYFPLADHPENTP